MILKKKPLPYFKKNANKTPMLIPFECSDDEEYDLDNNVNDKANNQ